MSETEDKYDLAIEFLTSQPDRIRSAWGNPSTQFGGCLFAFLDPGGTGNEFNQTGDSICGCVTAVRCGRVAYTEELTQEIRNDQRVPTGEIKVEDLPIFAYYQRKMDAIRLELKL